MNNLDKQYQDLLQDILNNGVEKKDRTGTGTISVFGRQFRHKMSDGFPLLTTKKMAWKTMVTELLWFLKGDTNIKYLVDNNCHIWDGDAYKKYESSVGLSSNPHDYKIDSVSSVEGMEGMGAFKIRGPFTKEEFIEKIKTDDRFAKKWGELGPIYGKQWRKWSYPTGIGSTGSFNSQKSESKSNGYSTTFNLIDQIANLINDLKTNPDSRRLMVNAWNVGELNQMVLPPCHYGFQLYARELTLRERGELFTKTYPGKSVNDFAPGGMEVQSFKFQLESRYDKANIPTRGLSLMWNQRSVDTFLGLPFNIASYGLLLEIIAKEVNMVPDELIGNLGDVHLYSNHIEQAKEQIERTSFELPKLIIDIFDETNHYIGDMDDISEYNIEQFKLENYQSHPSIKAPLSN